MLYHTYDVVRAIVEARHCAYNVVRLHNIVCQDTISCLVRTTSCIGITTYRILYCASSICYAARRSPLRGKAGLASQGNYGPDQEVDDSLGGPTAGAAPSDQLDRTNRAASPRPHPNGTRRVTSDMAGSEPGRRRSVGTYQRNRQLNVRRRARLTATIHSLWF
jgi:hypothetical protein